MADKAGPSQVQAEAADQAEGDPGPRGDQGGRNDGLPGSVDRSEEESQGGRLLHGPWGIR